MSWFSKIASIGTLVMYHATLAGTKIISGGFKTREQLEGKSGLGGGPDNAISFTTDWATAKGIFDAMLFFWNLANAPDVIGAMKQHFSSLTADKQQKLVEMHKGAHGRNLAMDLAGYKPGGVFSWDAKSKVPLSAEELSRRGFIPNHFLAKLQGESLTEDGRYYNWLEPLDSKDISDLLYQYVKSYFASDEDVYNPLFFGSGPQYFVGIPREDIGIITAEVDIDPTTAGDYPRKDRKVTYGPVGSMAEIRVFDMSIIKNIISYETSPGDTPPASSLQQHYHESDAVEEAGRRIIKVVKKYYQPLQKFLKGKVAMDGLISAVQTADDMYKMAEICSYILKETDLIFYLERFGNINKCLQKMKLTQEVEQPISALPEKYRRQLFGGKGIEEIAEEWYDEDRNGYSDWSSGFGSSDIERDIRDWQRDYNYFRKQYIEITRDMKNAGSRFKEEEIPMLSEFVTVLNSVRNMDRNYRRQR